MSKLSQMILNNECRLIERVAIIEPIKCLKITENVTEIDWNETYKTRIMVEFGVDQIVSKYHLSLAKERARKYIIEEVFGEFRKPLYEIHNAIFMNDIKEANKLVEKLINDMFEK